MWESVRISNKTKNYAANASFKVSMDALCKFTKGCEHLRIIKDFYVTFGHNVIIRELCSGKLKFDITFYF